MVITINTLNLKTFKSAIHRVKMKNIFVCSNHGSYFCNGTLNKIIIVGKNR